MGYELMDRVIEELNGVLPQKHNKLMRDSAGNRLFELAEGQLVRFSSIAFENRAKELGWINGYKYGVEYPSNGKKPDLPDDVVVEYKHKFGDWHLAGADRVYMWDWSNSAKFRIVDERYKPVSEITDKPKTENPSDSSWHKGGEYPPAGTKCEVLNNSLSNPEWEKAVIHFVGKIVCVYSSDSCTERCARLDFVKFRPIKSERDKFIEAGVQALKNRGWDTITKVTTDALCHLYDAGFRAPDLRKT
ncbi:hypothetical protein [Alishewanella phage vB_AspM_Slickus01]|nr:hypothetical protein [Alishewanella phage vB_AspM_Slickus01]